MGEGGGRREEYLGGVEEHLGLGEDAVLREMVVEVAAIHQVEDEAEFVRRLEGVRHADDEGTVLLQSPSSFSSLVLPSNQTQKVRGFFLRLEGRAKGGRKQI